MTWNLVGFDPATKQFAPAVKEVLDDTKPDALGRNPLLRKWTRALAKRDTAPAKMLVLSDSLTEAMGNSAWLNAWPHQLMGATAQYFIPVNAEWNTGAYGFDHAVLGGGATKLAGPTGVKWLWYSLLDAAGETMTFNVAGLSEIIVLWFGDWGVAPMYSVDGSTAVVVPNTGAWSGNLRYSVLPVTGNTLVLSKNAAGTSMVQGLMAKRGPGVAPIQVHNLARAGAKVSDWNTWLADTNNILVRHIAGINPDLVNIGLGGNDYWDGVSAADFTTRLTAMIAAVRSMCPNADIVLTTQPPGNDGDTPDWDRIQNATRAVASAAGCTLVDWRANFPKPSDGAGLYHSDGVHFADAGSRLCRDLAAPALLPDGFSAAFDEAAVDARVRAVGDGTYAPLGLSRVAVPTYAALIALTPDADAVTRVKVAADEDKGLTDSIYELWPDGARIWLATMTEG